MAYNLMLALIAKKKKTQAQLTKMANVYYAAGQFATDEEYMEVMEKIAAM